MISGKLTLHSLYGHVLWLFSKNACVFLFFYAIVLSPVYAQDYTITTTGGNLVITDNSGNGETLTMARVSFLGVRIRFTNSNTARTYRINSGAVTPFTTPADVLLGDITNSITINSGGGNDDITINTFAESLPSLTINGGSGDDVVNMNGNINLNANANLDIDLQNDAVSPGLDRVRFSMGTNIGVSGTGTAVIRVSRSVEFSFASRLATQNGNLTIEANQQAVSSADNFFGITLSGATAPLIQIQATGSGIVTLRGRGGNTTANAPQQGIRMVSGAVVSGGTTGTSTIVEGIGGFAPSTAAGSVGVIVSGAGTRITSSGGNVTVTGRGGENGASGAGAQRGVEVADGGLITAGGSGTVAVTGQGGTNSSAGSNNHGVRVATASGGVNAQITSSGGNVTVIGTSGLSPTSDFGVSVETGGIITAGGSGNIAVTGTCNTSGTSMVGIAVSGGRIESTSGNVTVTGTGGGTGTLSNSNIGIRILSGGIITAGGSGTVNVNGQGGVNPSGNINIGVRVAGTNSQITSSGGNITVSGTGGGTGIVSTSNHGVEIGLGGQIITSSGGVLTITGVGGVNAGSLGVSNSSANGISASGNAIINTNSIQLDATIAAGTNTLTIRPNTANIAIDLGSFSDPAAGPLSLSDAEINQITAGTLVIGDNASGNITVIGNVTRTTAINTQLISGGDIITSGGNLNIGGTLLLNPGATGTRAIRPERSGTDFTASSAMLNRDEDLLLRINGTISHDVLTVTGNINLNGAVLRFTGSYLPVGGEVFTIVNATGTISSIFNGLADNTTINNFLGSGLNAVINYHANTVTITVAASISTWNGTAWSNGTGPTAIDDVTIASTTPSQPPSFTSKNLTVNTGVNMVIANGVTATVNGVLNYAGNITVQSGGSLVQTEGSTLGTTTGTFRAQRNVSNTLASGGFAYNHWGSPVQAQAASSLNASSYRRRYTFHEPTGAWRNSDNGITSLISVAGENKFYTNFVAGVHRLVLGVGYTSAANQTGTFIREFTGTPNNGNITVNTSRLGTGTFAGYNFVGNPYASAILIADGNAGTTGLLEDAVNADFEASAYVFTDSEDGRGTGSYRVVNAAGAQGNHVAAMQGFFVIRKGAPTATSGNLTFRNAHRVGANNADANFYRGEAVSTEHLSLLVRRADRVADNVALALADNFADEYENGRDAKKLDANNELNLAARWNGERLAQLAIGKKENLEIPLALNTNRTGEHIFTAENLPTATTLPLFLEDRATGEFYYLQAGREHKINIAAGRYENRFFIRTVDEAAKSASVAGTQVFSHGRELFVKANANGGTLRIFNLMGVELWKAENVQAKGLARLTVQVPSSGIYVVKYTDAQGSTEAKVWLEK